jgi:hypothetical protein
VWTGTKKAAVDAISDWVQSPSGEKTLAWLDAHFADPILATLEEIEKADLDLDSPIDRKGQN